MILLGLDLGAKKTGVAVAKEGHIFGRESIVGWNDLNQLKTIVAQIIKDDRIDKVVYGIPLSRSGDAAQKVQDVVCILRETTGIIFEGVDETLTSVEAKRRLYKYGDKNDDREAAKVILEDYTAR